MSNFNGAFQSYGHELRSAWEDASRKEPLLKWLALGTGAVVVIYILARTHPARVALALTVLHRAAPLLIALGISAVIAGFAYLGYKVYQRLTRPKPIPVADAGQKTVALTLTDLHHHVHAIGPTGSGKTTLMERLFLGSVVDRHTGGAYFDPKDGEAIEHILERIPRSEWDRVVLVDPTRKDFVVGLNPLECPYPEQRAFAAEQVVGIFHRLYYQYWKYQTDHIMRVSMQTLMGVSCSRCAKEGTCSAHKGTTLLDVFPLLNDEDERERWTRNLTNRVLLDSWSTYNTWKDSQRENAIAPLLTKLSAVLVREEGYRLLGQQESTIDIDRIVNRRGIMLCNLSKGQLGDDTSALIGSFLVARMWQAVQRRSSVRETLRPHFTLCLDEFQNFSHSFGTLGDALAESRSLRAGWVLGHQYRRQVDDRMWEGVETNTLTKFFFAGPEAKTLTSQPLGEFEVAVKRRLPGVPVLVAKTRQRSKAKTDGKELAAHALNRWARPTAEVDAELGNERPKEERQEPPMEGKGPTEWA